MQKPYWKRLIQSIVFLSAFTLSNQADAYAQDEPTQPGDSQESPVQGSIVELDYAVKLDEWNESYQDSTQAMSAISAQFVENESSGTIVGEDEREGYDGEVYTLGENDVLTFTIDVPEEGFYHIGMDYFRTNEGLILPEFSLQINNEFPFFESRRFIAPSDWQYVSDVFETNNFGNELIPDQEIIKNWQTMLLRDANYEEPEPLRFLLTEGEHTITIQNTSGTMNVGDVFIVSPSQTQTYAEYQAAFPAGESSGDMLEIIEAETPAYKNDSSIRPVPVKSISTHPYDARSQLLNSFGGDSWIKSGQSVTWEVEVPTSGWYQLTLKTMQNIKQEIPVYRTIMINGEVPFQELEHYRFAPSSNWENQTLMNEEGTPYEFYLEAGTNELTIMADTTLMTPIVQNLERLMREIGDLGLQITQLTGNQPDANRDWDILMYLPDVEGRFDQWIESLSADLETLTALYGNRDIDTTEETQLKLVITQLENLSEELDELPNRLGDLSEGSSSATQLMGDLINSLQSSPLLLDRIYVHTDDAELPNAQAGFWQNARSKIHEFFLSFQQQTFDLGNVEEDTLEVWVGRSQQFVEVMQNMADSTFTMDTGIKVKFSVMPNEQKLILANSAGQQPDVALGISVGTPYELAVRGAAADLTIYDDFEEVSQRFSPGAFLPLMLDGNVYALPETQDFYVLYYRTDIMERLGIPIPNTWDEVTQILPELQRAGMNFFVPLSGSAGMKPFMFTAPFIYQFGGDIYSPDGMSAAIDSENSVAGMDFMTKLYTLYSLPLQVPNFYNSFRYGTLPIGISNFETYVQLRAAAPEIANSWSIAPHPGVEQEDGEVVRWTPGSAQTSMIFEQSDMKEAGWEFLKWWSSVETQVDFATNMQTTFGPEYMWHTANLEAFSLLPWPQDDKEVILEQWEYLREVPKIPGAYMIEREISNVWTDVVFNGANLRASVDDGTLLANREILRKMEEFHYIQDGEVVKPYVLPTLDMIYEWGDEE